MSYSVTRDFPAPAEIVFSTATDPDRWGRWLPSGMRLDRSGPGELRVTWGSLEHTVKWQVAPDRLRATADLAGQPYSAAFEVTQGPAGASTAQLEIEGDSGGRLRSAAERALAHLADEVQDNFNVS